MAPQSERVGGEVKSSLSFLGRPPKVKAVRGKRANMKDPDFEDPNTFKDPIDKKFS